MLDNLHGGNTSIFTPIFDVIVGNNTCIVGHAIYFFAYARPIAQGTRILLPLLFMLLAKE
tara:strand:- start:371 stop:550 length:180 start_codon:yes stop_codon:yes gene_type:complete